MRKRERDDLAICKVANGRATRHRFISLKLGGNEICYWGWEEWRFFMIYGPVTSKSLYNTKANEQTVQSGNWGQSSPVSRLSSLLLGGNDRMTGKVLCSPSPRLLVLSCLLCRTAANADTQKWVLRASLFLNRLCGAQWGDFFAFCLGPSREEVPPSPKWSLKLRLGRCQSRSSSFRKADKFWRHWFLHHNRTLLRASVMEPICLDKHLAWKEHG